MRWSWCFFITAIFLPCLPQASPVLPSTTTGTPCPCIGKEQLKLLRKERELLHQERLRGLALLKQFQQLRLALNNAAAQGALPSLYSNRSVQYELPLSNPPNLAKPSLSQTTITPPKIAGYSQSLSQATSPGSQAAPVSTSASANANINEQQLPIQQALNNPGYSSSGKKLSLVMPDTPQSILANTPYNQNIPANKVQPYNAVSSTQTETSSPFTSFQNSQATQTSELNTPSQTIFKSTPGGQGGISFNSGIQYKALPGTQVASGSTMKPQKSYSETELESPQESGFKNVQGTSSMESVSTSPSEEVPFIGFGSTIQQTPETQTAEKGTVTPVTPVTATEAVETSTETTNNAVEETQEVSDNQQGNENILGTSDLPYKVIAQEPNKVSNTAQSNDELESLKQPSFDVAPPAPKYKYKPSSTVQGSNPNPVQITEAEKERRQERRLKRQQILSDLKVLTEAESGAIGGHSVYQSESQKDKVKKAEIKLIADIESELSVELPPEKMRIVLGNKPQGTEMKQMEKEHETVDLERLQIEEERRRLADLRRHKEQLQSNMLSEEALKNRLERQNLVKKRLLLEGEMQGLEQERARFGILADDERRILHEKENKKNSDLTAAKDRLAKLEEELRLERAKQELLEEKQRLEREKARSEYIPGQDDEEARLEREKIRVVETEEKLAREKERTVEQKKEEEKLRQKLTTKIQEQFKSTNGGVSKDAQDTKVKEEAANLSSELTSLKDKEETIKSELDKLENEPLSNVASSISTTTTKSNLQAKRVTDLKQLAVDLAKIKIEEEEDKRHLHDVLYPTPTPSSTSSPVPSQSSISTPSSTVSKSSNLNIATQPAPSSPTPTPTSSSSLAPSPSSKLLEKLKQLKNEFQAGRLKDALKEKKAIANEQALKEQLLEESDLLNMTYSILEQIQKSHQSVQSTGQNAQSKKKRTSGQVAQYEGTGNLLADDPVSSGSDTKTQNNAKGATAAQRAADYALQMMLQGQHMDYQSQLDAIQNAELATPTPSSTRTASPSLSASTTPSPTSSPSTSLSPSSSPSPSPSFSPSASASASSILASSPSTNSSTTSISSHPPSYDTDLQKKLETELMAGNSSAADLQRISNLQRDSDEAQKDADSLEKAVETLQSDLQLSKQTRNITEETKRKRLEENKQSMIGRQEALADDRSRLQHELSYLESQPDNITTVMRRTTVLIEMKKYDDELKMIELALKLNKAELEWLEKELKQYEESMSLAKKKIKLERQIQVAGNNPAERSALLPDLAEVEAKLSWLSKQAAKSETGREEESKLLTEIIGVRENRKEMDSQLAYLDNQLESTVGNRTADQYTPYEQELFNNRTTVAKDIEDARAKEIDLLQRRLDIASEIVNADYDAAITCDEKCQEKKKRIAEQEAAKKKREELARAATEERKRIAEEKRLERLREHELLMEERKQLHELNVQREKDGLPKIPYTPVLSRRKVPWTPDGVQAELDILDGILKNEKASQSDGESRNDTPYVEEIKKRVKIVEDRQEFLKLRLAELEASAALKASNDAEVEKVFNESREARNDWLETNNRTDPFNVTGNSFMMANLTNYDVSNFSSIMPLEYAKQGVEALDFMLKDTDEKLNLARGQEKDHLIVPLKGKIRVLLERRAYLLKLLGKLLLDQVYSGNLKNMTIPKTVMEVDEYLTKVKFELKNITDALSGAEENNESALIPELQYRIGYLKGRRILLWALRDQLQLEKTEKDAASEKERLRAIQEQLDARRKRMEEINAENEKLAEKRNKILEIKSKPKSKVVYTYTTYVNGKNVSSTTTTAPHNTTASSIR